MISFWWFPFFRSRSLAQHMAIFIAQHRKIHPLFFDSVLTNDSFSWSDYVNSLVKRLVQLGRSQTPMTLLLLHDTFHTCSVNTDFRTSLIILFAFLILQILLKKLYNIDSIWFADSTNPFGPENSLENSLGSSSVRKIGKKMTNNEGVQLCSI